VAWRTLLSLGENGLGSGAEAMEAVITLVGTESQGIQNDAFQYASAFCPIHNSRFALRAGSFGPGTWPLRLIRVQPQ
jgi:hypothetical protein